MYKIYDVDGRYTVDKLRRIVGIILIITGIAIIGNVAYKKIITLKKQNEIANLFENGIKEGNDEKKDGTSLGDIDGYEPIAKLEIPSIKLSQIVVEGISDDVLQYYLGHFPTSVKPGEVGNFAVAGHRVSDYTDAFINLYKVVEGDEIIIETKEKRFTYEITKNFIVDPDNVEVLADTKDTTITLVTCTVGAKQRVIVQGVLKSTDRKSVV